MGLLKRRPSIKKTCDFCNGSAFGLMRRHHEGKTYCSAYCEASFANCRMSQGSSLARRRSYLRAPLSLSVWPERR